MGNNNLTIREVKRNNNDTFPVFINSEEESLFTPMESLENNSYQGSMNTLEKLLDDAFGCVLSKVPLGGGKNQIDLCEKFIKRYSDCGFDDSIQNLVKNFLAQT
jgi:hypothetical protein